MSLYCGIDLHSNNSVISIIDDDAKVVHEKRHTNDLQVILNELAPYRTRLTACVIESTYNWYWLADGLADDDYDVRLAHTPAISQYSGLKHTNDHSDARHLANLFRLGILHEGYIFPPEQRAVRELSRHRQFLVHKKTECVLKLHGLITRYTGRRLSISQIRKLEKEQLNDWMSTPTLAITTDIYLARHGTPNSLQELMSHQCLVSKYTRDWQFVSAKGPRTVTPTKTVETNDLTVIKQLTLKGAGIAIIHDSQLTEEIETGQLVKLPACFTLQPRNLSLVHPSRELQSVNLRRFIELVLELYQS